MSAVDVPAKRKGFAKNGTETCDMRRQQKIHEVRPPAEARRLEMMRARIRAEEKTEKETAPATVVLMMIGVISGPRILEMIFARLHSEAALAMGEEKKEEEAHALVLSRIARTSKAHLHNMRHAHLRNQRVVVLEEEKDSMVERKR
jgi:hypothetical protein